MKDRAELIREKFKQFNGNRIPAIFFENQDIKYISYCYDEKTDSLIADGISIPFHYKIEDIEMNLIDDILYDLENALIKHYKEDLNIDLVSLED